MPPPPPPPPPPLQPDVEGDPPPCAEEPCWLPDVPCGEAVDGPLPVDAGPLEEGDEPEAPEPPAWEPPDQVRPAGAPPGCAAPPPDPPPDGECPGRPWLVDTVPVPLGTAEGGGLEGEAGAGGAVGAELRADEPPSPPEVMSRWAAREALDFDERPSSLLEDVLPLVWRELRGVGIVIDRGEKRICK